MKFPIVGIGASAGGLEAFKHFFSNMPAKAGMAFVVIQHLDPKHESMSTEILSRTTQMPVAEVKDAMHVEPNHVYVIPPNTDMAIANGILNLLPRATTHGLHLPIDFFFQSLAEDQKTRAIGVVLSGTGSDGTQGLKAIKAEGGIACVQDPKSAKYDVMPKNAIASGAVDFVLPPAKLAVELARLAHHPYIAKEATEDLTGTLETETHPRVKGTSSEEGFRKIFSLLRKQMQVDFSNYKQTTIKRRIQRRMMVHKIENIEAYAKFLQDHLDEVKELYADILIHVTGFFRDPEPFKVLKDLVFPKLMKNRPNDVPIRIWVAGCSTGEEAYSIAISLLEFLGDTASRNSIQIFATDISEAAIQKARAGIYPDTLVKGLSKERLKRFFDKVEGGYKINKSIRDFCLFSRHDVTSDPPFAKLDLVSCRNLLIYFEPVLQKRVIPIFHYALKPGGFLWLGRSESPGGFPKLFSQIDKVHKIYSKIEAATALTFQFPLKTYVEEKHNANGVALSPTKSGLDFEKDADRIILSKYGPPGVVINEDMDILQFRGRIVPYLEPAPGQPSYNLLKMARSELLPGLRMAIQSAKKENTSARKEGLSFEQDKRRWTVNIDVTPINPHAETKERRFLVLFEDVSSLFRSDLKKELTPKKTIHGSKRLQGLLEIQARQIGELQKELKSTHEYQESLAEEYEATQEELTATNEELQSANEELQSSNEELETAKEELQSSNEELTTVNDELQNRNTELTTTNNDLNNLISSVEIPLVIVGNEHHIRRFTPKAEKILNLISTDVGRSIGDIKPNFDLDLDALVSEVIDTMSAKEVEIQDRQGRWSRVQVRPYKTVDRKINGAVITVLDIQAIKQQLEMSHAALNYAQSVAETVQVPLVVLDRELAIKSANRSFYEYFHLSPKNVGDDFFVSLGQRVTDLPQLHQLFKDTLIANTQFKNIEVTRDFSQIGRRTITFSGNKIRWIGEKSDSILVSLEDITERKNTEVRLALESANIQLFEALATAANEASTVEEALQIFLDRICAHTGWPVGHAYLLSDVFKGEFVSSKVWHLDDPKRFKSFREATERTRFAGGMGFPGQTVSNLIPNWTFDFSKDPILSKRVIENTELKVAIAFPVPTNKKALAVLEFFSTNVEEPDTKLLDIMAHISPQLGRVIERKKNEQEHALLLIREKEARAEAEKANQAKDLFLAILSHELRTPLTTILSWAQMLRMGKLNPEKSKKGIEMIEQSAQAQGQLINDLLDVSRIIMGKLPLDLHPVNPAVAINAAIDLIRPIADKKSIQIKTAIDPSVGLVLADAVRLQQVIWNLLTNAVKFSSEGKRIDVQLDRILENAREFARIEVSDEGKGISPTFLPQLFNRFSQADSSSTRIHGGLGLGLALVRTLIELQEGTVQAESPGEGKGATFTIKIPILPAKTIEVQNSGIESVVRRSETVQEQIKLDGLKVLLVDDEENTRESLTLMLQSFGAEVQVAASASDALEIFPKFKPQVLVSDIAMPGEDGYSLIRKIKALGQKESKIPALALTAYAAIEDVKRAYDAGFRAHISKPADAMQLIGTIARLAGLKENR